jgi:excisionase family DNA binding protein
MSQVERWLSVEEICSHLGVSKETIYRWLEKKKIPAHKLGRLWKFQASEVDCWIKTGGAAEDHNEKGHRQ